MTLKETVKGLKTLITFNCILLFVIPLGHVLGPLDSSNMASEFGWYPDYFYTDIFFLVMIAPFYLLWGSFLIQKENKLIQNGLLLLLLAISAFYSFISFMSVSMISPDYQPYWGMLILFLFFPLLVILAFFDWKVNPMEVGAFHEDTILDEENL